MKRIVKRYIFDMQRENDNNDGKKLEYISDLLMAKIRPPVIVFPFHLPFISRFFKLFFRTKKIALDWSVTWI